MHRGLVVALALALAILGLGPSARSIPFSGTLGVHLEGQFAPSKFRLTGEATAGAGGVLQVDGLFPWAYLPIRTVYFASGASFFIGGGALRGAGIAGTLAPSKGPGGGFGGSAALHGIFTSGFVRPNYTQYACFGVPDIGRAKGPFACGNYGTLVSVTGWTTGNLTLTGMGGAMLQTQGYDARTPGGRGNLLLVTPIRIEGGLHHSPLVGLGTLSLAFVPEPGTLSLTATGALALAALGWRRRVLRGVSGRARP